MKDIQLPYPAIQSLAITEFDAYTDEITLTIRVTDKIGVMERKRFAARIDKKSGTAGRVKAIQMLLRALTDAWIREIQQSKEITQ